MIWIKIGSLVMFAGVALGAFGSHTLRSRLNDYYIDVYKTAVLYHLIHGLALFVVAWVSQLIPHSKADLSGIFLFAGIVLFSGSLYVLCLTGQKWLGMITPLGGFSFLVGWALLFLTVLDK
jgi:uncharacterized membrane protein YgdD (TMEM256/DUF423 family)